MNLDRGYIKLWRCLDESRVFQNEGLLKVWIWCLIRADHRGSWVPLRTGRGTIEVHVPMGTFLFGRKQAAKALKIPGTTIWDRLLKLQDMGNITIESHPQYSIIHIVNWELYQGRNDTKETEEPRQLPIFKNDEKTVTQTEAESVTQTEAESLDNKASSEVTLENPSTKVEVDPSSIRHPSVTLKKPKKAASAFLPCPHKDIIALFHEVLPSLPKVKAWTPKRERLLLARWRSDPKRQSLNYWGRTFFPYVAKSDFLMRKKRTPTTLEWLLNEENFTRIIEGKYHDDHREE